ncbi:MAG: hypothetical protein ACREQ5_31260, partial [Candidatus Dormibacteria bacterium]
MHVGDHTAFAFEQAVRREVSQPAAERGERLTERCRGEVDGDIAFDANPKERREPPRADCVARQPPQAEPAEVCAIDDHKLRMGRPLDTQRSLKAGVCRPSQRLVAQSLGSNPHRAYAVADANGAGAELVSCRSACGDQH